MAAPLTPEDRFLRALQSLSTGSPKTVSEVIEDHDPDGYSEPGFDNSEPTQGLETTEEDDGEDIREKSASPSLTSINLFQHPDSHPIVLDLALLKEYGPEWLTWEAEVVAWRVPQDFRTTHVSDLNMEKIQAVKTLHMVNDPWREWQIFLWTCMAVNGIFPDFDYMQVPTAAQTMVAISIFGKVRQDVQWSDEVKNYLGVVWRQDGVLCTIPPADFFEIPDTEDLIVNCSDVRGRWTEVRQSGKAPTADTPEEEQLRRLLLLHDQLREDRERLDQQLSLALHG
jgi:hypothetical protein